eukprot:COSAG02_NODE_1302_length_13358_cov_12.308243_5_plen_237_part_00
MLDLLCTALEAINKFRRSVHKVKILGAMDSLPLHYFKEHAKYTGTDKVMKADRVRQQRILESLHGQFHAMLEDVEFLHRCFTLLDGDDDGRLTAAELKRWISLLNEGEPTNEELKDALDMMPGKGGVEIDGEVVLADPEVGVEFEDFLGVCIHLLTPALPWTSRLLLTKFCRVQIMQDYYTGLGAAHLRLIYVDMLVLEPGVSLICTCLIASLIAVASTHATASGFIIGPPFECCT